MREIKFRAWDGEKMWHLDNWATVLSYCDISGWNIAPNDLGYRGPWLAGQSADGAEEFQLLQFTGLYDSKGVEIYEGDVVEFGHIGSKWLVHFHAAKFIGLNCDPQKLPHVKVEPLSENCTIIGNRYDHPGLVPEAK